MKAPRAYLVGFFLIILFVVPGQTQLPEESVDLTAVAKIRDEALQRSQVMELTSYLTDVHGPRLTGSPNTKVAAEWTMNKMKQWGISDVRLETWPFGRGWTNDRFYAAMVKPYAFPLIGNSKAWAPGTNGTVVGDAVLAVVRHR